MLHNSKMTEAIANAVLKINTKIADRITFAGWSVQLMPRIGGGYISIVPRNTTNMYFFALCNNFVEDSLDISLYRWALWSEPQRGVWVGSELTSKATIKDVLAFLKESVAKAEAGN